MIARLARLPAPPLEARLLRRDNGLNLVRLVLAGMVAIAHALHFGAQATSVEFAGLNISAWGVYGFFVVSGFLVTRSAVESAGLRSYLAKRVFRIYPLFWVCLVVTALLAAPLYALIDGSSTPPLGSMLGYIVANASLHIVHCDIGGQLAAQPIACWNPSLWTLEHEFACYVLVFVLALIAGRVVPERRRAWFWLAVWLGLTALNVLRPHVTDWESTHLLSQFLVLSPCFFAGAFVYSIRHRLRASWPAALVGLLTVGVMAAVEPRFGAQLGAPLFAWALLAIGARLPSPRWVQHNDLSYGLYVWAMPVTHLLVALGVADAFGSWGLAALVVVATLPVAWLGWRVIERPALRLGRRLEGGRAKAAAPRPARERGTEG